MCLNGIGAFAFWWMMLQISPVFYWNIHEYPVYAIATHPWKFGTFTKHPQNAFTSTPLTFPEKNTKFATIFNFKIYEVFGLPRLTLLRATFKTPSKHSATVAFESLISSLLLPSGSIFFIFDKGSGGVGTCPPPHRFAPVVVFLFNGVTCKTTSTKTWDDLERSLKK